MINRRIVAGLAALTAIAAVNVLAACTPSDDRDALLEPDPTPLPPELVGICQIVWANDAGGGLLDVFVVEGAAADFQIGSNTVGGDPTFMRWYEKGVTLDSNVYTPDMPEGLVTTAGDFSLTLTLNGNIIGEPVRYDDSTNDALYGFDTAGELTASAIGSAGLGTFSGQWSDLSGPLTLGSGMVQVMIGSTSMQIGNFASFAGCHEAEL